MKRSSWNWYIKLKDKWCRAFCTQKWISDIEISYIENLDQIFFDLVKELSEVRDKNVIFRRISEAIVKIFNCDEVYIYIWDMKREGLVLENFFLRDKNVISMPYSFMPISFFPKIKEIIEGKEKILKGWELLKEENDIYDNIFDFSSSLMGAFYEKNNFKGIVFAVWKQKKINFTERNISIFNSILNYLSNALTQSVLYEEVMSLAVIDTLTSLYNRRFFDDTFEREFERAKRYKRSLSLVMFDINDFKYINDNFGHLTGDMVLREVSRIIKENIRSIDIAIRYGGDEIVLLLPETPKKNAKFVVEKIREELKKWNATSPINGFNGEITLSAGYADIDEAESPKRMLELADNRMYEDKKIYKRKKRESRDDELPTLG